MGKIKIGNTSEDDGDEMAESRRKFVRLSDEDIEDATETAILFKQAAELVQIKERMYEKKLASLTSELKQLKEGIHPAYLMRLRKLEAELKYHRLVNGVNDISETYSRVHFDNRHERAAIDKEFEQKKIELRKKLISELEEQKRLVEVEQFCFTVNTSVPNKIIMQKTLIPIMRRLKKSEDGLLKGADLAVIRRLFLEDLMDANVPKTRNHCRKLEQVLPTYPLLQNPVSANESQIETKIKAETISKAEAQAATAETNMAKVGTRVARAGTKMAKSGTKMAKSGTKKAISGTKKAKSGTKKAKSGTMKAKSGTMKAKSGTKNAKSGTKKAESGTKKAESGTKTVKSGTKMARSGIKIAKAETRAEIETGMKIELKTRPETRSKAEPQKKQKVPEPLPQIKFLLDEKEIQEDLDLINKLSKPSTSKMEECIENQDQKPFIVKVQARKLYYNEKCYRLGHPVIFERKGDGIERNGHICSINPSDIWVKTGKNKFRVPLTELKNKDFILKNHST